MPGFAQSNGWEGYCTFDAPGTYVFVCSTHATEMTGTVVVEGSGEPTPTPTPTPDRHTDGDGNGDSHVHTDQSPGHRRPRHRLTRP